MDDSLCSKRWRGLTLALLLFPSAAAAQELGASYLNLEPIVLAQAQDESGARDDGGTSVSSQIEAQRSALPAMGGGPAVDAQGGPAVDPTANVIAILRAATQRQDDLREASERFLLLYIDAAENLNSARSETAEKIGMMRYEAGASLRAAESRRLDELALLRSDLEGRLEEKEAGRIDAIRAVDVNAVQVASQRAVEQANVLAQQVAGSAETLRALVASTEQSVAASQEQSTSGLAAAIERSTGALSTRIAALEQAQYVGQGQSSQRDPAFTELQGLVRELATARSVGAGEASQRDPALITMQETLDRLVAREATSSGATEGSADALTWIFAGFGFLVTLIAGVAGIAAIMRSGRQQQPAPNGTRQNGNGGGAYA